MASIVFHKRVCMGYTKCLKFLLDANKLLPNHLLLLLWRYNSDTVLAFSTISFHFRRSCTCSAHFISFIFFRAFMTSPSHRDLGLPAGLPVNGFHLCILFTVLVSGILFMCPNQLNRCPNHLHCHQILPKPGLCISTFTYV